MTTHGLKLALYGNIAIPKGMCPDCHAVAFIKNHKFVCCGAPVDSDPVKVYRESEPEQHRHRPSKREQIRILQEQGNRCFYCDMPFHLIRHRKGTAVGLKIEWDHKVPYSATQNNQASNFVAACHVCNGIKSNFHYQTVDEARVALADRRAEKGYDF